MGAHGVSQAAAQALRQLQDQLAAAYTDLAACQVIPFCAIRFDRRLAKLVDTLSPGMLFTLYMYPLQKLACHAIHSGCHMLVRVSSPWDA